jgi:hypothetical protein
MENTGCRTFCYSIRRAKYFSPRAMDWITLLWQASLARRLSGGHFLVAFDTTQGLTEQSLQFLKAGLLEK